MIAAWGDSDEDESEEEANFVLMAKSDSESENEDLEPSIPKLKKKLLSYSKEKVVNMLIAYMNNFHNACAENDELATALTDLKHETKHLTDCKLELEKKNVVLEETGSQGVSCLRAEIEILNEKIASLEKSKDVDSSCINSLKSECDETKHELNVRIQQNEKLQKELNEVKKCSTLSNINSKMHAWLYGTQCKKRTGLGFKEKSKTWNPKGKYVGLPEYKTCMFCGNGGHETSECLKRSMALERNLCYVRQIWVRKDSFYASHKKGPKQVWVPKSNN
ncbi:hypothetical protein Dimus_038605 [Dionaea muscipula]